MSWFLARPWFRSTIFSLAVASATTAGFAAPPSSRIDVYLGLWEGVDGLDGSLVRLSLSDVNDDGVIEFTQTESFYSVCHSMGAGFTKGQGVEIGTATVAQKRDVLKIDIQLICIDDGNGKHENASFSTEYQLRSRGTVLVVPEFSVASLPVVLHRVSQ